MEFSVKKFDLLQELSLTQGVVERKTTIPILGNILCEASGNKVTLCLKPAPADFGICCAP